MTKSYLLEIGLEEIPARFLKSLSEQLRKRTSDFLTDERISFESISNYATPRRLAVKISGLASKQTDIEEKAKGPALRIAQDESGQWTKAAQGFARGQGVDTEDLLIEAIDGVDYVFANKFIEGQPVETVLKQMVTVLQAMTFPISMRWHNYSVEYIRPFHWFVSLLNDQVIDFDWLDVKAGRRTQGHRFLGHSIEIAHADDYVEHLKSVHVMVDYNERREHIRQQIADIGEAQGWQIPIDEDLLDEVTSIVEWPTAFYGDFDESYLTLPKIVLVTAMRDHQRYFYTEDPQSTDILPYFISVRNGNAEQIDSVVRGNQKVLRARLEDALFFYQQDLEKDIRDYTEKLESVNEHYKLGTLADKQRRVEKMIPEFVRAIEVSDPETVTQIATEAAQCYKFDLMTNMVGEFDELQGQMGAHYAIQKGMDERVAQAIATQYLPVTSGGDLPDTDAGAVLSICDKLDTLIGYFKEDMQPTGSADPYSLRRQAMGILEILLDRDWHVHLEEFLSQYLQTLDVCPSTLLTDLVTFISNRIVPHLEQAGVDYDIINAVKVEKGLDLVYMVRSALQLQALKTVQPQDYRHMMEALTRVVNLGIKADSAYSINTDLAQSSSEKQLMTSVMNLPKYNIQPEDQLETFSLLIDPITHYFEQNMVNDPDESIRTNRYATMRKLTDYILMMLDPREIITKFDHHT